jgi:Mrp family chromosome partitioning ATPase
LGGKFGIRESLPGLSEWLQSDLEAITNIYHLQEAGLWFLPAGCQSENNLELAQSERLSRLMNQLTDMFDWILIDSPPVAPLADTSVWMRTADGVLLVVREGTTRKRQLQSGLRSLEQSRLLGVVLNSSTNTDHDHYYQRYAPQSLKSAAKSKDDKQKAA